MSSIRSSDPQFVHELGTMLTDVNRHLGYLRISQEKGEVTVCYEPKKTTWGAKIIQYVRRLFTPSFNINQGIALLVTKLGEQEGLPQQFAAKADLDKLQTLGQHINKRRMFRKINIGAVEQRINEVMQKVHFPAEQVADFIKTAFPSRGIFNAWKGTKLSPSTGEEVEVAVQLAKEQFILWLGTLSLDELRDFQPRFAKFAHGSPFADIVDIAIQNKGLR